MSPLPSRCSAPITSRIGARVHARGHAEADARREIRLDQAGDHVHAGTLRRQHQVHADRARHLRQPRHALLHVAAFQHHQVGQLVDQDQDVGQRLAALPAWPSSSNRLRGSSCSLRIFLLN